MILKRLFCSHQWKQVATVYGDEIIGRNYKRRVCACSKCGAITYKRYD